MERTTGRNKMNIDNFQYATLAFALIILLFRSDKKNKK